MRFTSVDVGGIRGGPVCAIGMDGRVYCWGDNRYGQLGLPIGTPGSALDDARAAEAGQAFTAIETSGSATCASATAGGLYCWGNAADTLRFDRGDITLDVCAAPGRTTTYFPCTHRPLRLRGTEQWARFASSGDSCAITVAGGASCWGVVYSEWGGSAVGRTDDWTVLRAEPQPQALLLPTPVRDIVGSGASYGSCAHAVDGRVVCWGDTKSGAFGTGAVSERFTVPTVVAGGRAFAQLSAGGEFMCGLTAAGEVWCWGAGQSGYLGTGTVIPVSSYGVSPNPTPTRVASIAGK